MSEKPNTSDSDLQHAEKAAVTLPGTVEKIIPAPHPALPEKAQIAIEGADELYKEIRIENKLAGENGKDVKLKAGTEVAVTIEVPVSETAPQHAATH